MNKQKISDTMRHLVGMLVAGDYAGLEAVSLRRRLTAEELRRAWEEYGGDLRLPGVPARELRMPPESVFETFNEETDSGDLWVIELKSPRSWAVLVDLWTVEEGRSDLTLEVVLTDTGGEQYDIEIVSLHVM
jgi:hypothetical protein